MGDMSAMSSIDRVLAEHSFEILAEIREQYPSILIERFELGNNIHSIEVTAILADNSTLPMEPIDIDALADKYPCCEVGY